MLTRLRVFAAVLLLVVGLVLTGSDTTTFHDPAAATHTAPSCRPASTPPAVVSRAPLAWAASIRRSEAAVGTLVKHRHQQLNINQYMTDRLIRADVKHAFRAGADTIVFNEAIAPTHAAIRTQARARGYGYFIPHGAASQIVLAWTADRYELVGKPMVRLAMPGRAGVSQNRYVVAVLLRDRHTRETVALVGSHMVSSGWTGSHAQDTFRRAGWRLHLHRMTTVLQRLAGQADVVIWSMDANRPPDTFKNGRPLPTLRTPAWKDAATAKVAHTSHTHGRTTFDYVGVISAGHHVVFVHTTTPGRYSDHDSVIADLKWAADAPATG